MALHDPRRLSRRQFARLGTQVAGAIVAVLLGIPIVGFLISPLFRSRAVAEASVGDISDVPDNKPTRFVVQFPAGDWSTAKVRATVYVVKHDGNVKALSNTCTHMQCPVHWDENLNQFLCPCHGGLYNIDGGNIGGPPPKPLPEYVHRLDGNNLYVENQFTETI